MNDTIFAQSSGLPPSAIGIIRISGPRAGAALEALAGRLPDPRRARLAALSGRCGTLLDRALLLWFPGPDSATGEDLAELHCHGGRAVIAAVERELAAIAGMRRAEPGEFTRRAFINGRIDLAEAEGLADLLAAETELQRAAALASFEGGLSRLVSAWRERVLLMSAEVEAALDFSGEDDVAGLSAGFASEVAALAGELRGALGAPRAERLREGIRVVIAGPVNAGKSSLFNALLSEGVAIVSSEAGTTRDVIERPVSFSGTPFVLIDTAGLRAVGAGKVEAMGIDKARTEILRADIVLWLGPEGEGPQQAVEVDARADLRGERKRAPDHVVSSVTGEGIAALTGDLVERARRLLPRPGAATLNSRQWDAVGEAAEALESAMGQIDHLLLAELLRRALVAFDRLLGRRSTEEMLDALFGRFCIGK